MSSATAISNFSFRLLPEGEYTLLAETELDPGNYTAFSKVRVTRASPVLWSCTLRLLDYGSGGEPTDLGAFDYAEIDFDGGSKLLTNMAGFRIRHENRGVGLACRPIDSAGDDRSYQVSDTQLIVHQVDELETG